MDNFNLEKITLEDNLLLLCLKNSNFFKVCLEYKLNNLREIFDFFKNNDILEKNKHSYMEIHGLVNILKHYYLNEKILFWNKLNRKTLSSKGNQGDKSDYLYYKYYDFFRSLGFTSSETFELCYELEFSEQIGNAILRLYLKKIKTNRMHINQENYVFLKKLEIFANYYLINFKGCEFKTNDYIEIKVSNNIYLLQDSAKNLVKLKK